MTVNIDFEKFNQRWRHDAIWRAARLFDEWFGTSNLFNFVHDFFANARFYLCSAHEPPTLLRKPLVKDATAQVPPKNAHLGEVGPTVWQGQQGAGEGLWQKGWTMIIIGALHAVEYLTGIHSAIMGQGDNQVVVISWRIPYPYLSQVEYVSFYEGEFTSIINRYLECLTDIVNGLGMKVKLEETWISTQFMSYGKEPWYNGVFMSTILKKRGRTFLEVNDIHPTARGYALA